MQIKSLIIFVCTILIMSIFINMFIGESSEAADTNYIYVDNAFYAERDGSPEHPLGSIQEAINAANEGDTIYVYGGIYHENLVVNKKVKLWGSVERGETIIESRFDVRYIVEINADQVEFQGFTINDEKGVSSSPIGALLCIKADNVVVQSNLLNHTHAYGIYIDPVGNGNFISGNTINDTKKGIYIYSSYTNDVFGNIVTNCTENSIELLSSSNDRLYQNTIIGGGSGVYIHSCTNTNVSYNNISQTRYNGIYLGDSNYDILDNNNISNNPSCGIYVSSFGAKIYANILNNNSRGINLQGSDCEIYSNVISNSTATGVYALYGSQSNILYFNNITNNSISAKELGDNIWYNALLMLGNNWSDYHGIDVIPDGVGDGIGDTYYSKGGVLDKYPLGIFDKPPLKPYTPYPTDFMENVGLQINLEVTVTDPDGDLLNVYFYRADTDTLVHQNSMFENVQSGKRVSYNFTQGFDTIFAWYVIINDSKLENKSDIWIFSTKSAPPENEPPVADPGSAYSGLVNTTVFFDGSNSYDPDGNIVFFRWNFGDGSSEILSESPSHIYLNPGTYTVILSVVDNNGTVSTNTSKTTIYGASSNKKPIPYINGPSAGRINTVISFDGSGSSDEDGSIKNFTWSFGDGTSGYGAITTHTYSSTGKRIVTLTVTDNVGDKNSISKEITIQPPSSKSPGFELILIISAIALIFLWRRKRV